jgi:hypothetical protein
MTENTILSTCRSGLAAAILLGGVGAAQAGSILVGDASGTIYNVDVTTRVATAFVTPTVKMRDIAYVNNTLYGVDKDNLYTITGNGVPNTVGALGAGSVSSSTGMNALFYDGTNLFGMSNGTTDIYKINTGTGAATSAGITGFTSEGDIEEVPGDANNLFATTNNTDTTSNPNGWSDFTKVGKAGGGNVVGSTGVADVWGLAYSMGTLYGAAGSNLYTINTGTGAATLLGQILIGGNTPIQVAYGATRPVPLPAAVWLFGSAMLGMLGIGRLGRKTAAA